MKILNNYYFSGGLNYIDLKMSGAVVRAVAARRAEGVFSVRAEFTPCGRYVLYYHSKRRTLRKERPILESWKRIEMPS